MAVLTVQVASLTGTAVSTTAAAGGGDSFANDGNTTLTVANGGGGGITVTFTGTQACSQGFTHDAAVSVGAGATLIIGPFPVNRFGTSVAVTYSGVTSVTVAARRH